MSRRGLHSQLTELFRRVLAGEMTAADGYQECLRLLAADTEKPALVVEMMQELQVMAYAESRANRRAQKHDEA
jgi:hypothetical protein